MRSFVVAITNGVYRRLNIASFNSKELTQAVRKAHEVSQEAQAKKLSDAARRAAAHKERVNSHMNETWYNHCHVSSAL